MANITYEPSDEEAFRLQFNPQSLTYHNGDATPVPLGGRRVPSGCTENPGEAEGSISTLCSKEHFSAEYKAVADERDGVKQCRDTLIELGKLVGMASGQQCVVRCDPEKAKNDLDAALSSLSAMLGRYTDTANSPRKDKVISAVSSGIHLCKTLPISKDAYGEYLLALHGVTAQLFQEMKHLLADLKRLKQGPKRKVDKVSEDV